MMYHSVIKKYRYHIRRNVYQLYKIRRHGMAMHPGALDIDDVARARPAPNQLLAATPALTMVVLCTATLTGLLLYRSSVAWGWVLETGGSGGIRSAQVENRAGCVMPGLIPAARPTPKLTMIVALKSVTRA